MDEVVFKRIIGKKGLTPGVSFPSEILDYADIKLGDHVLIYPYKDKAIMIKRADDGKD